MLRSASVAAHRLVLTAAIAFALGAIGCSDRACIRWSAGAGSCPSAVDARPFFGGCSNIESINSPPESVAGNLCCYDVKRTLDGLPCQPPQMQGQGGNTPPSSSDVAPVGETATVSGVGGAGGVTTSQGGAGGVGGAPNCDMLTCGFNPNQPVSGCLSCAETMLCQAQSNACENSADCLGFEDCLGGCSTTDEACIAACRATFPDGAPIFEMFLQCAVCDACPTACASSPVRMLTTCGGGTGGQTAR